MRGGRQPRRVSAGLARFVLSGTGRAGSFCFFYPLNSLKGKIEIQFQFQPKVYACRMRVSTAKCRGERGLEPLGLKARGNAGVGCVSPDGRRRQLRGRLSAAVAAEEFGGEERDGQLVVARDGEASA